MTDEGNVSPEFDATPEPAAEVISASKSVPDAVVPVSEIEPLVAELAQPEPMPEVVVEPTPPVTVEPAPAPEETLASETTPEPPRPAPVPPPSEPKPVPPPPVPIPEPSQPPPKPKKSSAKNRMLEVVRARRAERLEKIVQLAREKRVIRNDEIEKLLKVSDATVTNYLNALVLTGRLRRFGHGRGAKYQAI